MSFQEFAITVVSSHYFCIVAIPFAASLKKHNYEFGHFLEGLVAFPCIPLTILTMACAGAPGDASGLFVLLGLFNGFLSYLSGEIAAGIKHKNNTLP